MARRRRDARVLPADRRAVAALSALVSKDPLQLSGRAVADGVAAAGEAVAFVQARMYLWAAALAAPEKIPSAIGLLKYPAKAAAAKAAGSEGVEGSKESRESRERADARRRMAGAEVSAALTLSPVSGDLFVDRALNLVGELQATWAVFERGGLDQQRMRMVHDRAMRVEDPERIGEFEARALALVPGRAPAQLERLLDRLWLDMHPVAAAEAEERAFQQRCTGRRDLDHAMSRFYAELRVEDAVMVQELIDAIARTLDEQDGRTLAQRRADVFVSIFARLAEGCAVDVSGILAAAAVLAADPDLARHAAGDSTDENSDDESQDDGGPDVDGPNSGDQSDGAEVGNSDDGGRDDENADGDSSGGEGLEDESSDRGDGPDGDRPDSDASGAKGHGDEGTCSGGGPDGEGSEGGNLDGDGLGGSSDSDVPGDEGQGGENRYDGVSPDGEDLDGFDADQDSNEETGVAGEGFGRDRSGGTDIDTGVGEQVFDPEGNWSGVDLGSTAGSPDDEGADDRQPDEQNLAEQDACVQDSDERSAAEENTGDAGDQDPVLGEPVDGYERSVGVLNERAEGTRHGLDEGVVEDDEKSERGQHPGSDPECALPPDEPTPDEGEAHPCEADATTAPTGSSDPDNGSGTAFNSSNTGTSTPGDPDEPAPGPDSPADTGPDSLADTGVDEPAWAAAKEEARARRVREFATRLGPRCHRDRPCDDAHENCTDPLITPARGHRTVRRGLTPHLLLTLSLDTYAELAQHPGHLEHYGAVSPDLARTIAALFTSVQLVIIDPATGAPVGASKRRYVPSTELARKVRALSRTCSWYGCSRPAERCDTDHHIPYNHDDPDAGGATDLCNLEPYCRFHHRLKTHTDWTIRKHPDRSATFTTATGRIAEKPPPATTDPGEWTDTDTWITTTTETTQTDTTEQVTDADEPPPF
ncbi:DUF222 domain-containing protein [Nakamurella sp. YIM 132087]|uniref:DUF222 domain-containing protein n=1 Tax=Nakamurella alba TaxID=2665158 RepID=A0A7K1FFV8_9ACTN|nr:DUF222 domain-containing protein [Nakamurella alba]MTD12956.1 DUF222 domain-containing protein [Nakamurella alba]